MLAYGLCHQLQLHSHDSAGHQQTKYYFLSKSKVEIFDKCKGKERKSNVAERVYHWLEFSEDQRLMQKSIPPFAYPSLTKISGFLQRPGLLGFHSFETGSH